MSKSPVVDALVAGLRGFRMDGCSMKTVRRFRDDETAATAIEYGLLAAGISLAIISAVNGTGSKLSTRFTSISTSLH